MAYPHAYVHLKCFFFFVKVDCLFNSELGSSFFDFRSVVFQFSDAWGNALGFAQVAYFHRKHFLANSFEQWWQFVLRAASFSPPTKFYAMVSLPGNRLSLNVCMLMTSSVFTMTGAWGLCLRRRWHFRDTLSSSTMALQKDLCGRKERFEKKPLKTNCSCTVNHCWIPLALVPCLEANRNLAWEGSQTSNVPLLCEYAMHNN